MRKDSLDRPDSVPEEVWEDCGPVARAFIVSLVVRLEAIERKLGMNSSNSSRPPSSDLPDNKPAATSKPRSGRKRGGQPGHQKHERSLIPTDQCDEVLTLIPDRCGHCSTRLAGDDPEPVRHQVTDLPEIKPIVIEYQRHRLCCPHCGRTTLAELPAGVPTGRFGPRLISAVTLLGGMCRLSKRLTVLICENLLGVKLCTGTVCKLQSLGQQALRPAYDEIAAVVRGSPAAHADETSWRESNTKHWLWTAVAPSATRFLIRQSRSQAVARELLGEDFAGVLVSDRYGSYAWVDDSRRQFCWAHLLRDFQAMIDASGAVGAVGEVLHASGQELIHRWHQLQDGRIQRATFNRHLRRLKRAVMDALLDGLSCNHPATEGTCVELLKHDECLWTFTRVDGVSPTNNAAERAVRTGVIWRKLSFGTNSDSGSRYVETILSVLETCRQQTHNPFTYVTNAVHALHNSRPAPKIIAAHP